MKDALDVMLRYANQDRMAPAPFCIRYRVYAHVDHMWRNCTARKLAEKKISSFPIISQPSAMSFALHLSSTIRIRNGFYISEMEPKNLNLFEDRNEPPRPPLTVDGKPEYLI